MTIILPKAIYTFHAISLKIPQRLLQKWVKIFLKSVGSHATPNSQENLEKEA